MRVLIRCAAVAAILAAFAPAAPSLAQQGERWSDTCNDLRGRRHRPDARIAGCTTLIESDMLSIVNLAYAHHNRGLAYAELGNHRRALADFDRAIRYRPAYAAAYFSRGIAYRSLGDLGRAIDDFREALRLAPGDERSRAALCEALARSGAAADAACGATPTP